MSVQGRTLVTAPTDEIVSLTGAKLHLREDGEAQDSLIRDILIPAARQWVERKTWRALVTQTWDFSWYRFPHSGGRIIEVPMPPLQSITHVKYYDTDNVLQTLSSSAYIVDTSTEPGTITLKEDQSWPETYARPSAVIVRAVCGYGDTADDVPAHFRHAAQLLIGHWYANRENVVTGTISTPVQDTLEALIDLDDVRWRMA